MKFKVALIAAKFTAWAISIVAKGRGTNLPGRVALKIDPDFIKHIKGLDLNKTIFVTGTNGKSTTTNLMAHIFRTAGYRVAVNLEGANLIGGVVVSLLKNCSMSGRLEADIVLMETDERFLPIIHKQLPARHICVTNVQKDQVQRNGEPEIIRRKISSVLSEDVTLYVNGDEPRALSFGKKAGRCIRYGVDRNSASFDKQDDFFSVTMPCPVCNEPIEFETYNIDNIGPFRCTGCGFGAEKNDYQASDVDFDAKVFSVRGKKYRFEYSTPYFLYCYVAALTVADEFGVSYEDIAGAFSDFELESGRLETIYDGDRTVKYMRMKQENPETVQSAINVIASDADEKVFMLGLDELTDFEPHYTNTFYSFDCDFQKLTHRNTSKSICFSGTVAYDTALRLLYDGFDPDKITVLPTNDDKTIIDEVRKTGCNNAYLITWLHKFETLAEYVKSSGQRGDRDE